MRGEIMSNLMPLVSVVIPAYNRVDLLEVALKSVFAQSYQNFEIILVDDGSSEDLLSLECLHDERVHYFKNENHGVAFSRNYGIRKANGKYIAFLDSDDVWLEQKLEKQVYEMEKTHFFWSQHSYFYLFDETKKTRKINTHNYEGNAQRTLFCSFKVQTSCFMVEREAIIKNNCFFDENITFGEDNEFYYSMLSLFPLLCIDDYLAFFRIKKTNAGRSIEKQLESRAYFYEKHKCDPEYICNTSPLVKFAYWLCFRASRHTKLKHIKIWCEIVYSCPWLIFKIETWRLTRKH